MPALSARLLRPVRKAGPGSRGEDMKRIAVIAAFALPIAACAVVSSHNYVDPSAGDRAGVLYMLPKAVLPVRLVDAGGTISIDVEDALVIGDEQQTFILKYNHSVLSADNVKLGVDPKTNLLQSVDIKAEDKTGDIIKKVAATVLRPEGSEVSGQLIMRAQIDPANSEEVDDLNRRLALATRAYVAQKQRECGLGIIKDTELSKACTSYRNFLANVEPRVQVTPSALAEPAAAPARPPRGTNCSVGVCYRPGIPYRISVSMGAQENAVTVLLPNRAPSIAIPLSRFALVTATHKVTLKDGMLEKVETDKPSEGLALASLPLDIVREVFSTASELVNLKIDLSGKEKALADARVAEIKARNELEKERLKTLKPEGAVVGAVKGILVSASAGLARDPAAVPSTPLSQMPPSIVEPGTPFTPGSSGSLPGGPGTPPN